jgi:chromosome partitioning protein
VILTVASYKGGVGKSTSAVHLAAFMASRGPTLLIDGDPNRSVTAWSKRGSDVLPFRVIDERQAARFARDAEHIVIDTAARPNREDLEALVGGCDLLVIPTTPDALALDALMLTAAALAELGAERFKVLLTIVPPRPSRDADEARQAITEAGLPMFANEIRRAAAFGKAALQGCVVSAIKDPRASECWRDYERVALEIMP